MTKFAVLRQTIVIESKIPVPVSEEAEWPAGPMDPELLDEVNRDSSAAAKKLVSAYGGPWEIVDMKAEGRIVEV